jgi:hypothetical protein
MLLRSILLWGAAGAGLLLLCVASLTDLGGGNSSEQTGDASAEDAPRAKRPNVHEPTEGSTSDAALAENAAKVPPADGIRSEAQDVEAPGVGTQPIVEPAAAMGDTPKVEPPLERLLAPWHRASLEQYIKQVDGDASNPSERLLASQMILVHDIALAMERAGTALPMARAGQGNAAFPSKPKFYKDGRAYCFEEVEFPLWMEVQTYQNDETITPPRTFWDEVSKVGEGVVAALRKD